MMGDTTILSFVLVYVYLEWSTIKPASNSVIVCVSLFSQRESVCVYEREREKERRRGSGGKNGMTKAHGPLFFQGGKNAQTDTLSVGHIFDFIFQQTSQF